MHQSEKNFLEKIADVIPGIKGYRAKESRRDTDKRLRVYMATELDKSRRGFDSAKRELLSKGRLDLLDDAERTVGKIQRAADSLRHATYGYSGLFDQVKIREEELERLFEFDNAMVGQVRSIEPAVTSLGGAEDPEGALKSLEGSVDELIRSIEDRKQLFNEPGS